MRQGDGRKRKKSGTTPRVYRFDARIDEDQKLLIQRAADLEGRTMTDFVLHSAKVAAERTIQERAMMILSARDTEVFVAAMLKPAEPGPALRAAARGYKTRVRRRVRTA
jgi:uncharacterized protein (DUF1778 family)